MQFVIEDV